MSNSWRRSASLLGALLFCISAWILTREVLRLGPELLGHRLSDLTRSTLAIATLLTAANYLVLTWHDQIAFRYAGLRLPRHRVGLASFVGYAVSNNVGFALVSGASARYRFYSRWGLTTADVSRVVLFYSTTFWLGLCLIGGISLVFAPPAGLDEMLPRTISMTAGLLALLALAGYVALCLLRPKPLVIRGIALPMPGPLMLAAQISVSTVDWLLGAAILFALLPPPQPSFLMVAGAFTGAQLVALVSHVPGGLGVFEGLMLVFLDTSVPTVSVVSALLVFRVIYYLLPLGIALAILLIDEGRQCRRELARWSLACRSLATWMAPRILAASTFVSGAILLFSGATPAIPARVAWVIRIMPLPLLEASHFTASLAGVLLLLLAQAVARRVDAAFYVAGAALAIGSVASVLKGGDYEEAIVLAVVLLALIGARKHFTRRASIFSAPLSNAWCAAVATVVIASIWLGFFAYRDVAYRNDLWWQFAADADAPRFLRASVAVTIAALILGVRQLLRPALVRSSPADESTYATLDQVIPEQSNTTAYLAYLGDKSFLWNEDRTAFVMFGVRGRSCIALSDPIGPRDAAPVLIREFLEMSIRSGSIPVFYETSAEHLATFADHGLSILKIGEDARVPLHTFSTKGRPQKDLRVALNRTEREGFVFRIVPAEALASHLPQLRQVSDEWLAAKGVREKGFSLGYFDETYVRRFPVAMIEREGMIAAFATLWLGADRAEISSDLMRYRKPSPPGVMDALFAHMMLWGQQQGYEWFNLGMAPLAGLPSSPVGQVWTRFGRFVYRHAETFYNFRGVRAYKDKFDPVWDPRYLVFPGGLSLVRVLTDVTTLIAGGYSSILFRAGRRVA